MTKNLPDICTAVSEKTGVSVEAVRAVVENFLFELHRRAIEEPEPAEDYIITRLSKEISPTAYFHLLGTVRCLMHYGEAELSNLQRDLIPLSAYLVGSYRARRWKNLPLSGRVPDGPVEIELEVQCSGGGDEGEICWVTSVLERVSGEELPVDGGIEFWDENDIDRLMRRCADALAQGQVFEPGVYYELTAKISAEGIWAPERSGSLAFRYAEGMKLRRDDEDHSDP